MNPYPPHPPMQGYPPAPFVPGLAPPLAPVPPLYPQGPYNPYAVPGPPASPCCPPRYPPHACPRPKTPAKPKKKKTEYHIEGRWNTDKAWTAIFLVDEVGKVSGQYGNAKTTRHYSGTLKNGVVNVTVAYKNKNGTWSPLKLSYTGQIENSRFIGVWKCLAGNDKFTKGSCGKISGNVRRTLKNT